MGEFLRSYGIWIALGVLFLLMVKGLGREHGHGGHGCGGCGTGEEQKPVSNGEESQRKTPGSGCH